MYQFQCEDAALRQLLQTAKVTKPEFKCNYKYVYDAVLNKLDVIRATPEGPELDEHFAKWAKDEL